MTEDYLPLAYLNAWEYCPRRFYLEYVLGEMEDNEHIILGRHIHRNVNEETTFQEGETLIHQQQWVWSESLESCWNHRCSRRMRRSACASGI
jgi:CRISPR-associated exonuclease Cas4